MKRNKVDIFYRLIMTNDLYLLILLSLIAFFVRFGFLALSDNFKGAQPMLNIITSLHIFNFPGIRDNIFYQQMPVFLYSLYCATKLAGDQIISGRLLSVFWGSMSLIPFYCLVNKLFNKKIALFSSILFCFHSQHVINSIITMPDVAGIFFLLCAIYYLVAKRVIRSAVFASIAAACTYVCWFFIPILFVFILLDSEQKTGEMIKRGLVFLLFSSVFPLLWIMLINNKYGASNLFYKNSFEGVSLTEYLFVFMSNVSNILKGLFERPVPLLFVFGLAGFYQSARDRKYYKLFYLIGALILFASLGIFRKEILVIEEAILLLSILSVPFIVLGIDLMLHVFGVKDSKHKAVAVGLICFWLLLNGTYERPYLPRKIKDLSCWIKDNVHTANVDFYISKDKNNFFSSIIMLSGLPQQNFLYYSDDKISDIQMSKFKVSYVIYFGFLDKYLSAKFDKVSRFDDCWILTSKDQE